MNAQVDHRIEDGIEDRIECGSPGKQCETVATTGWSRRCAARRVAALLATSATAALAACSGSPRAKAPPAGGKLPPAKIRYLHWDRPRDEAYAQVWREFSQQHPGVEVELNTVTGVYTEKLLSMLVSGDAPDIFALDRSQLEPFVQQGGIADLTPFVKRDSKARWSDLLPTLQAEYTFQGKVVELPNGPVDVGIFYNKDEFAKQGLKPPAEGWTWDDLVLAARRLTQQDGATTTQWGFGWVNSFYEPWVWGNGGEVFDKPFDMTKCLLDQPKATAGLQWYADLVNKHRVAPRPSEYAGFSAWEMFYKAPARFPLVMSGSWRVPTVLANTQFKWDVAPLPRGPIGKDLNITWSGGTCINKASKAIEQAWALTVFMWGPEREREAVMRTGANLRANLPNYMTTIKDPEIDKALTKLAQAGTVPPGYGKVFFHALLTSKQRPVAPPAAADATKALNAALNEVWEGKRNASEAMQAVVPALNAALATAKS
ncbi:MAG: sugar ABC transporter substrate-binding protein [Chloroflexi bacterium]|nr:sugar ABC transporter substrate-binding protein [Chloroflexota bacterium]